MKKLNRLIVVMIVALMIIPVIASGKAETYNLIENNELNLHATLEFSSGNIETQKSSNIILNEVGSDGIEKSENIKDIKTIYIPTSSNISLKVNEPNSGFMMAYKARALENKNAYEYGVKVSESNILEAKYNLNKTVGEIDLKESGEYYFVFVIKNENKDLFEWRDILIKVGGPSDWAKEEIEKAKLAGLITDNTSLSFQKNINRGQFAELIVNMVEKTVNKELSPANPNTFTDTTEISILKAYNSGIVSGVSETKYAPKSEITREQIATMIYRAITYIEKEKGKTYTVKNNSIQSYTDKNSVSSWAKQGVGILANNNIMAGTSKTTISPKSSATIEQSILLIYRLFNIVKN